MFTGKYTGFRLCTGFYYRDLKGRARLSYLCGAVGITGQLKDPKELVGKRAKLRIVPKLRDYKGKTYRDYLITRFHPLG